jgi:hypothetical protein
MTDFIRRPAAIGDTTPLVRPLDELNRVEESVVNRLGYQTFKGWSKMGRHVRRGEKHEVRNQKGEPLFSKFQTDENDDIL